jgi:hypothetical protein
MHGVIRFECPACGKRMRAATEYADRRTLCHGCGQKVRVSSEQAIHRALPYAPPAVYRRLSAQPGIAHPRLSSPDSDPRSRGKKVTFAICVLMTLVGGMAIVGLAQFLEAQDRADEEAWANETVAAKVQQAESHLERREWEEAAGILEEALGTENATNLTRAQELLQQTRQSQAAALFGDVEAALRQKDLARAGKLLAAYLKLPEAPARDRAEAMVRDIERATSDTQAARFLAALPDATFTAFAEKGQLADIDRIDNEYLRALYQKTLERNLAQAQTLRQEIRRRQEQERLARAEAERKRVLEEKARRDAKVRATPVYRELSDFIARARKKDQQNRKTLEGYEKKLLEASAFLLAGNNQGKKAAAGNVNLAWVQREQEREEQNIRQWKEKVEEQISQTRAGMKERIRIYPGFDAADWAAFDQVVDRELDGLWKEIQKSDQDDFAL